MAMYEKNLTEDFRLRLSESDMSFLKKEAERRAVSVSEVVRSIIGEYRRSFKMVSIFADALKTAVDKEKEMSHGDTETDIDDQL